MMKGKITIINDDVMAGLKTLPDNHFQCVVTSPPYWGLRDYGVQGQLGLESDVATHINKMVTVFDEVRRVLKKDGILWLNYGDGYACAPNGRAAANIVGDDRAFCDKPFSTIGPIDRGKTRDVKRWGGGNAPATGNLKAKDLMMIPNRLAIALQEWGWWVRSECIWAKPNPMPDSARDRPAQAFEKIFMLTKSAKYQYAREKVRMKSTRTANSGALSFKRKSTTRAGVHPNKMDQLRPDRDATEYGADGMRNLRNCETIPPLQIWQVAIRAFNGAHFATFPPELVARCLNASGLKAGDKVLDPFGGAGTTGLVAAEMGCDATLIELNPEYVDIAANRLRASLIEVSGVPHAEMNAGLFAHV